MKFKKCTKCLILKDDLADFTPRHNNKRNNICRLCVKEYQKQYRQNNTNKIRESKKEYYKNNKNKIRQNQKDWHDNNKKYYRQYQNKYYHDNIDKIKESYKRYSPDGMIYQKEYQQQYRLDNKEFLREQKNKYDCLRIKTNPIYKLRRRVSHAIHIGLKANKPLSSWIMLPYSPQDLKIHLESLFEQWMTWENHGVYNTKIWNDTDPKTWAWNIDHIIPQSKLPYDSMNHPNFLKCWALENLRPYSAKQNVLDGNRR